MFTEGTSKALKEQTDGELLAATKLRTLGNVIYHYLKYNNMTMLPQRTADTDEPHFDMLSTAASPSSVVTEGSYVHLGRKN